MKILKTVKKYWVYKIILDKEQRRGKIYEIPEVRMSGLQEVVEEEIYK